MANQTKLPGEINAGSVYTLQEVRGRLGLGVHALRQAKRQGLKIRRVGNRRMILGRDVLSFVEGCEVEGAGSLTCHA